MTGHLPECPMTTEDAICCTLTCICDALRACEDRGARAFHQVQAVADARKAVAALDHAPRCELVWGCDCSESHPLECTCNRDEALAAIDAPRMVK